MVMRPIKGQNACDDIRKQRYVCKGLYNPQSGEEGRARLSSLEGGGYHDLKRRGNDEVLLASHFAKRPQYMRFGPTTHAFGS